jgi:hypothetical protein
MPALPRARSRIAWKGRLSLADGWSISAVFSGVALLIYTINSLSIGRSPELALAIGLGQALPLLLACALAYVLQSNWRPFTLPVRLVLHMLSAPLAGITWAIGIGAFLYFFEPVSLPFPISQLLCATVVWGMMVYAIIAGISLAVIRRRTTLARDSAAIDAELAALRAQVEPQFLATTLTRIGTMIRTNPDGAEQAVERLGTALRWLGGQRRSRRSAVRDRLIPLSQELSLVRDMLYIDQLRMGDRLQIVERIGPDVEDVVIPALTLQPLIDNAIRHGLDPSANGGTLSIGLRREGEDFINEISDDGVGTEESNVFAAAGLGLDHLWRRLERHYGSGFRFDLVTGTGQGFSIRLALPSIPPRSWRVPLGSTVRRS